MELNRRDMAVNGNKFRMAAPSGRPEALDFRLPFNEIDTLKLVVGFRTARRRASGTASFTSPISR